MNRKGKAIAFFLITFLFLISSGCVLKPDSESVKEEKLPERKIETSEEALFYGYQSLSKEEQQI